MRIAEKKRILHKVREEENEAKRRFFLKIEKPKHKKKDHKVRPKDRIETPNIDGDMAVARFSMPI